MEKETKKELRQVLFVLQLLGDNNALVRQAFENFSSVGNGHNLTSPRGWNKWMSLLQDDI